MAVMSVSCSECLSDLLCSEDSGILSGESSPAEYSSDLDSPACSEESIAEFIEDERNFVPGFDYLARFRSQSLDASAREQSVAWILKVRLATPSIAAFFSFLSFLVTCVLGAKITLRSDLIRSSQTSEPSRRPM